MIEKPNYEEIKVFCDGGSRGNPGPAASGVVFTTSSDEVIGEFHRYLGVASNNVAEYDAVVLAIEQLGGYNYKNVHFYLDSELVVKQLTGIYRIKHPDLRPVAEKILSAFKTMPVEISHVRREFNTLADAQVNVCLDAVTGTRKR